MKKILLSLTIIAVLGVSAISALFYPGFFDFHDDTQVARVFEMANSLNDGMFPVRWVEHLGYGYGYPIFNFYAPLAYYFGSVWIFLGFDALTSTKVMFGFGIILSGITMYFFSRRFFGNLGGIVSSVIYLYFPYHAVNIYVRGAVSEFFAYAFLPLVFYGCFSLMEKKEKLNFRNYYLEFLLISFGVFLIAISHNLSLIMMLLMLIPAYFTGLYFSKSKYIYSLVLFVSVFFGILLSSFYLLPAYFEMGYTNVQSQVGGGADFRDHFVCLPQLWNSMWGFGGSVAGCLDGMSFKLGKVNILISIFAVIIFIYSFYKKQFKYQDKLFICSLILLTVSLILSLNISELIWNLIRPMEYIQYPWRFLNFAGLFISFIAGYSVYKLYKIRKEIVFIITVGLIAFTILLNSNLFSPQQYLEAESGDFTNYEMLTKITSKVSDEYLPNGSNFPLESGFSIEIDRPSKPKIVLLDKKTGYLKFEYTNDTDANLTLNYISYFPSWNAYYNGEKLEVVKGPKSTPEFQVPRGSGILELKFEQTLVQSLGNLISVIAFLGLFIGIIYNIKLKFNKNG